MGDFVHLRHQTPTPLRRPRSLVLALPQLRSNVNLARIIRVAGCCGLRQVIACGKTRIDPKIARDALQHIELRRPRSLLPVLTDLASSGYRLVGLEQTSNSQWLTQYRFVEKCVLVVGHERMGISTEVLSVLDDVVQIPIYGRPDSFNVATATSMALYEYIRQFPS